MGIPDDILHDGVQVLSIPSSLRSLKQWVLWRYVTRDGKLTKAPYQPSGMPAKSNDPSTWTDFASAVKALERGNFDGAGFVFAKGAGIAGIDLDWKEWEGEGVPLEAQTIVDRLNSYTEWSPSRKGCHILLRGKLPAGVGNRKQLAPGVALEVYDHGRFFTVSGWHWAGYPEDLEERQAELEALLSEIFPSRGTLKGAPQPVALDDTALLERMFRSKHGADIRRLWEGDTSSYESHSEADLALAGHLMWWTGNDTSRADRLFRQSGLYRAKWDERHFSDGKTYGQATLEKARAAEPYDPHRVGAGQKNTPAEALEAHQRAVKTLEGLTPETWPEHKAALFEALRGLDPVSADLLLKQAANRLGVGAGAMQRALREHVRAGEEGEPTAAKELTRLALEHSELWRDGEGTAWATLRVEDHKENWPVRSRTFRLWLNRLYWEERNRPPNTQALQEALSTVESQALFAGAEHPVHLRVAHRDGVVWLDLGRPDWQAARITAEGWALLPPEVRFRRSKATGALPIPIQGGGGALKDVLSPWALEEDPRTLVVAWALGTLSPGPYPVLALSGEQGSGKSTLARTLQRLIDPSGDVGSLPRESRDLFIAAKHSHILAFDNISGLPPWLSDDLSKLATGGLLRARELYSNDEEVFLQARRPVILNGITDYLTRQDLLDRSILLHLPPLEQHQPEAELWADFEEAHPRALGGLLDLTALALRELPRTRTPNVRLADFARWALAAESGYARTGVFEQAFTEMRADAVLVALDNEPLYPLLLRLLEGGRFEGSAGELLEQLNTLRGDTRPPEGWPRTPHAVASWLKRTAPALRRVGVQVDALTRKGDKRRWAIEKGGGTNVTNVTNVIKPVQDATHTVTFAPPDDVSNVTANVILPLDDVSPPPGDISNVTPNGQMSSEESRAGRINDVNDVCDISTPHLSTQGDEGEGDDCEVVII